MRRGKSPRTLGPLLTRQTPNTLRCARPRTTRSCRAATSDGFDGLILNESMSNGHQLGSPIAHDHPQSCRSSNFCYMDKEPFKSTASETTSCQNTVLAFNSSGIHHESTGVEATTRSPEIAPSFRLASMPQAIDYLCKTFDFNPQTCEPLVLKPSDPNTKFSDPVDTSSYGQVLAKHRPTTPPNAISTYACYLMNIAHTTSR